MSLVISTLSKTSRILIFSLFLTVSLTRVIAEDNSAKLNELWDNITSEGNILLKNSLKSFSEIIDEVSQTIDQELLALSQAIKGQSKVDTLDKIDSIKIHIEDLTELKKKESTAPKFAIISKSKKDYVIKIDKVLKEIEPILFDGEILDYATRIRETKKSITDLKNKKVELNEKLVFAPVEKSLLNTTKDEINAEIIAIEDLIRKSEKFIDQLEFDLKRKMYSLGIELSREQIRIMTTRIDGDDLAKSFAIFDVTRQISNTLGILMKQNSFSRSATIKYYGVYVILSEILGFSQREYIVQIEEVYLPALDKIKVNINESIRFAEKSISTAKTEENIIILNSNIRANKFSLKVLEHYKQILITQKDSLERALQGTLEQITVAYSTYDTAANSANLADLIDQTQNSFNRIMDMQLPSIIPFENSELELKFEEISTQLANSTKS